MIDKLSSRFSRSKPLAAVSCIWFLILFIRQALPPLFGTFQSAFGITNTETGLLFSVLMGVYALMQFPSGLLSDRFGNLPIIFAGSTVLSMGTAIFSISESFIFLIIAASIIGLGSGMHKTVAIDLISIEYPQRRGFALGVMDTIGQLAGVVAPLVVVAVLSFAFLAWNYLFFLAVAVGSVLAIGVYILNKDQSGDCLSNSNNRRGGTDKSPSYYIKEVLRYDIIIYVVSICLLMFSWNAVSAFLPIYLTEVKGFSTQLSSLVYSLLFMASFVQVLTGNVSDNVQKLPLMISLIFLILVSIVVLVFSNGYLFVVITIFLSGLGFHGARPVRDSYFTILLPNDISGSALGGARTLTVAAGSAGPVVFGYIYDNLGVYPSMVSVIISLVGSLLSLCLLFICIHLE